MSGLECRSHGADGKLSSLESKHDCLVLENQTKRAELRASERLYESLRSRYRELERKYDDLLRKERRVEAGRERDVLFENGVKLIKIVEGLVPVLGEDGKRLRALMRGFGHH